MNLKSKAVRIFLWSFGVIIIILILTTAPVFIYTHSIAGLGSHGSDLTERSIADMKKFIDDPNICKPRDINKAALDVISTIPKDDLVLIVKVNALPKRIDFYIQQKSTKKSFLEISYNPDRGCDGIFLQLSE
jgi:hypothetical protein